MNPAWWPSDLDRIPESLDALDRRLTALVQLLVESRVEEAQEGDQDDREHLSADGDPKTDTIARDNLVRHPDLALGRSTTTPDDSHVSREIGLSVDGRGEDTSDTTHTNDNGGRDRLLGVGDGVGGLVGEDRGNVGWERGGKQVRQWKEVSLPIPFPPDSHSPDRRDHSP